MDFSGYRNFNSPSAQSAADTTEGFDFSGGSAAGAGMSAGPWVAGGLAAYQIISSAQQAELMRDQAAVNRQISDMNAKYAELDAWNAEQSGYTQEARYQTKIDQTVGAQKVAQASQDVAVGFGTAAELQKETKLTGLLNQMDIRNQAHATALGYLNQARNIRLGGSAAQAQGNLNAGATQNAGIMQGMSTGISGYSKFKG